MADERKLTDAKLPDKQIHKEIKIEKIEHKDWAVTRELLKKASEAGLTNASGDARLYLNIGWEF